MIQGIRSSCLHRVSDLLLRVVHFLLNSVRGGIYKDSCIEKEIGDNEKLRQVSVIREMINTNSNPLAEFGDNIFKAIVDKVIVRTPVSFSFILMNGMEFAIDGREYSDGRKFKTREY